MASKSAKLLYAPWGTVGGIAAGMVARKLFTKVWTVARHEPVAPTPRKQDAGTAEVLLAAVLQGAIYTGTKALFDRQAAKAFAGWSGEWPDDTKPPKPPKGSTG